MKLPLDLNCNLETHNGYIQRQIKLENVFTCILGPNGSGKTHLLRSIKSSIENQIQNKKVRFISAGRIGFFEQYRSDYDGYRRIAYDQAEFGGKDYASRRHAIETLLGDYQTLAQRPDILIKVQERLSKLFQRNLTINWDNGTLKIFFSRLNSTTPYSSGREASGLMHLVGILCALYDDEVGALFIDEPEVSLHPQLQSFLLNEILYIAGIPDNNSNKKLIVIATHSTEMLCINKPEDLSSLIFCYDLNQDPVQISSDEATLKNSKIQSLISKLGQEHKLTLFCQRPLLVEGPSDVVICNTLAKKTQIFLEASGSQILPVIGKDQIPVVAKLLKLLGKEPVILADADAISDGIDIVSQFLIQNQQADNEASKLGAKDAITLVKTINNDFTQLVNTSWEEIQALAKQHPYWINGQSNENRAKRRSAFSTLFSLNDENLRSELKENYPKWNQLKNRYMALMDILEKSGVFFLRKGAVESYYHVADKSTSEGKIDAAVSEIDYINALSKEEIYKEYEDIVKCLKFAAATVEINETLALRDILLAIIAPCMMKLQDPTNKEDLNNFAISLFPDKAQIFNLIRENDSLVIELKTKIIDAKCFPLTIQKDDDLIKTINSKLSIS
ncbi:ATP-dependent nuclease [Acinetobacter nosocomialis]|uniref:ATP-dependent nuclease n=1 Tax=Acinetobacter nosocomialis TaxID=106654 RepID=UPI000DE6655D|nr:AAA family ATPase [Acinetobacter nosocomialis]SSV52242.1 Predicted ATPase [Acinetobacter nosocomialis]